MHELEFRRDCVFRIDTDHGIPNVQAKALQALEAFAGRQATERIR